MQEKYLNSFKQYTMNCGNIDLHFVHERSTDPAAIPLVLLHGWPCNFTDFHKMIHPLTLSGEHLMSVLHSCLACILPTAHCGHTIS